MVSLPEDRLERLRRARRIAIVGNGGGGKTTLARALGRTLDLPVTHVDSVQFLPGWRVRDRAETARLLDAVAAGERWILDGFGGRECIARRLAAAEVTVLVDLPLVVHLARGLRRQLAAARAPRAELPADCPEASLRRTLRLARTLLRVHRDEVPWLRARVGELPPDRRVVLRSRRDLDALNRALVRVDVR